MLEKVSREGTRAVKENCWGRLTGRLVRYLRHPVLAYRVLLVSAGLVICSAPLILYRYRDADPTLRTNLIALMLTVISLCLATGSWLKSLRQADRMRMADPAASGQRPSLLRAAVWAFRNGDDAIRMAYCNAALSVIVLVAVIFALSGQSLLRSASSVTMQFILSSIVVRYGHMGQKIDVLGGTHRRHPRIATICRAIYLLLALGVLCAVLVLLDAFLAVFLLSILQMFSLGVAAYPASMRQQARLSRLRGLAVFSGTAMAPHRAGRAS